MKMRSVNLLLLLVWAGLVQAEPLERVQNS